MLDIESMIEKASQNVKRDAEGTYVSPVNIARLQATMENLEQVIAEGEERRQEMSRQFAVHAEKLETAVRVLGIVTNMKGGIKATVAAPKTARFTRKTL